MAFYYSHKPNARKALDYLDRLRARDFTLTEITLSGEFYEDMHLYSLADALASIPNNVQWIFMHCNHLGDTVGVKLAEFLAASATIVGLRLHRNSFGKATHMAIAKALKTNTSLQYLSLYDTMEAIDAEIEAAFVGALRVNPTRPADSEWVVIRLDDFARWEEMAHPTDVSSHASQTDCAQSDHKPAPAE